MVQQSRNGYACRNKAEIGCQQFIDGRIDRNRIPGLGFRRPRRIRFNSCDQSDPFTRQFQIAIDTKMIAAESTGSNDRDTTIAMRCYC